MTEGLDIRLILPFLKHRSSEPVLVNFIICAEFCGAILFIAFCFRVLFMVRHMYNLEIKEWRDKKMNELMESIAKLQKEQIEKEKQLRKEKEEKGDDETDDENEYEIGEQHQEQNREDMESENHELLA